MGIAILSGMLATLEDMEQGASTSRQPHSGTATPAEEVPLRLPSRFIACVRRPESAKKIRTSLASHQSARLTTLLNENVKGVQESDVVLLGCKPQMFREILSAPGMKEALSGKLLISILAGVTAEQIEQLLYGSDMPSDACRVVRAMPSTASFVRESMTVIANSDPPLPLHFSALVTWIFTRIGRVVNLPPTTMDVSTALCGSGPAFMAIILEAFADGAVAMGLPRAEAQLMAAQTMRGTAELILNGEHPAVLKDKVSTPGGCTIEGIFALEDGRVRSTGARAIREATYKASGLGKKK
jgi:pyrroline-5-carboxylate reductase